MTTNVERYAAAHADRPRIFRARKSDGACIEVVTYDMGTAAHRLSRAGADVTTMREILYAEASEEARDECIRMGMDADRNARAEALHHYQ